MSTSTPTNGSKVNLIAALGTGATAAIVLWLFIGFSRDQAAERVQNQQRLEMLVERQTSANQASALAMERLAIAVERVDAGVSRISNSGFGQVLGAIKQATEVNKQVVEAVKPEGRP